MSSAKLYQAPTSAAASTAMAMVGEDDEASQLVVVLETNPLVMQASVAVTAASCAATTTPLATGISAASSPEGKLPFGALVDALLLLANAHLLMRRSNSVAFVASHISESLLLYPTPEDTSGVKRREGAIPMDAGDEEPKRQVESSSRPIDDGMHEQFASANLRVAAALRELVLRPAPWQDQNGHEATDTTGAANGLKAPTKPPMSSAMTSQLVSSLSVALCHINKTRRALPPGVVCRSRILVVHAAEDVPAHYVQLMNTIFAAQKLGVIIDALILTPDDSGFLQQAVDLTKGAYIKLQSNDDLVQTLMMFGLADRAARELLILPQPTVVDYRSACFCHRRIVDVGFVCSVCLSIFCDQRGLCPTCGTRFKLPMKPQAIRKV
ncbi:general transcription factor IIH [Capsaspora owczarzaki ATCC 30864]|uniref:General transcription factor IIH n=1 Tax=Capsaspora owczarzaki (strain ATCC 30864) TaxID=595528 RepID=A0A0D2WL60_CAPO3|nr:general transcription factor IIH [Capsaspora owczarzaki ATCC 30864]KJE91230.1 general transcription factor IIH [Capsaspora owczarzaki ATCC 30864]|eukprot:XP_004349146.1 general transcription factor IIH [Capsaspora owczarzaki ATCC 30864]